MLPLQPRRRFIVLCILRCLRVTSSRDWTDCVDARTLLNDGMPRVAPPRNKTRDYESTLASTTNAASHMMAAHVEIEVHGSTTTLFEEADPFRITFEPSSAPSYDPTSMPSVAPSADPTGAPSSSPTASFPPTSAPTARPTRRPTAAPTFSVASVPRDPGDGYFNYDDGGSYGPKKWKDVEVEKGDPGYLWHTFELEDSHDVSNDCGSGKRQSPIDVCTKPRESCVETHEMRPKSGDYKMDSDLITKEILSNKLRLVMAPRTGEEPDPPQIDFASNGKGIIDMTNIDFKFPSEHTVCGHSFDGELQYFTYHGARKRFVAVSFFLDGENKSQLQISVASHSCLILVPMLAKPASETNPPNEHLQEVIDAFARVYKEDEKKCMEKQAEKQTSNSASNFARGFASGGDRGLYADDGSIGELRYGLEEGWGQNTDRNATTSASMELSGLRSENRRLALKWHPFHPDVQKSVHFWGYSGSFTDPPCTKNSVDWKIIDVPTPISPTQLKQLKHILFTHVDRNCRRTSVHNVRGSVARPTQEPMKYYKCTRDNYVSDEERAVCGDEGCVNPFGAGLNRYYPPLVDVTGPPTRSPSG
ncbi:hypothetical protein ACHAWF_008515 [Thalassiosira exigua]